MLRGQKSIRKKGGCPINDVRYLRRSANRRCNVRVGEKKRPPYRRKSYQSLISKMPIKNRAKGKSRLSKKKGRSSGPPNICKRDFLKPRQKDLLWFLSGEEEKAKRMRENPFKAASDDAHEKRDKKESPKSEHKGQILNTKRKARNVFHARKSRGGGEKQALTNPSSRRLSGKSRRESRNDKTQRKAHTKRGAVARLKGHEISAGKTAQPANQEGSEGNRDGFLLLKKGERNTDPGTEVQRRHQGRIAARDARRRSGQ